MTAAADCPEPASFDPGGVAVVVGASGALGGALADQLNQDACFAQVVGLSRRSDPPLDLIREDTIAAAVRHVADLGLPLRLVVDATGFLHDEAFLPEKSWRQIDPVHMAHTFAINAIGPALLMKHFLPLLPATGKSVFATLSARVGSIADNRLGGWHGYRASKAALNQIVRTCAIELRRTRPQAICVALHPGTVESSLSAPFTKSGLVVRPPTEAASDLLRTVSGLMPECSGGFYDYAGAPVPW
ncbi:SDR family NAD(P)-dependent oxidoreductase [Polymorphum gilvum]|uniref:Short-chain dehydrogenase/reductase SDR n=1 Tax=Polymorphum gilvum (strain LMG 25793 / CGMCC 1.9160 / SL003B-26A1) TaxID=991905 RepID=F2IXI8_POLGS|nr:SDR family NAD(P)-dependent oxidoreductase [Polymorphum gilvum]ADZ71611.1 Short-chain dehydrogenase/reductase SDR [Polymorphum gilvum SL003B-26A1]